MTERELMDIAIEEAQLGLAEGEAPIGAAIMDEAGNLVGRGHNVTLQTNDPTAHAEIMAGRDAGIRDDWHECTLATTLSPCLMCSGMISFYRMARVVIGDDVTKPGARSLLKKSNISFEVLNNPACIEPLQQWIEKHPEKWGPIKGHEKSDD
ncbi:nucleoside deaminase [Planctomycetota bacterium]|nr:nucleoside deaminase [Planctomycetota bacterium]